MLWQRARFHGDTECAVELLEHIGFSDPDKIDEEAIKYIQLAAKEIFWRIKLGEKPKADEALLVIYPQRKRQETKYRIRDVGIA